MSDGLTLRGLDEDVPMSHAVHVLLSGVGPFVLRITFLVDATYCMVTGVHAFVGMVPESCFAHGGDFASPLYALWTPIFRFTMLSRKPPAGELVGVEHADVEMRPMSDVSLGFTSKEMMKSSVNDKVGSSCVSPVISAAPQKAGVSASVSTAGPVEIVTSCEIAENPVPVDEEAAEDTPGTYAGITGVGGVGGGGPGTIRYAWYELCTV